MSHGPHVWRTLAGPGAACGYGLRARLRRARMTLRSAWSGMPDKMHLVYVTVEGDRLELLR